MEKEELTETIEEMRSAVKKNTGGILVLARAIEEILKSQKLLSRQMDKIESGFQENHQWERNVLLSQNILLQAHEKALNSVQKEIGNMLSITQEWSKSNKAVSPKDIHLLKGEG